ncbi:hypothetical protein BBJ28_00006308 [Nothophytophthora sp. Chile5]|nr:hypothetical protein BBJ28_00006308 [Nothophytophthora sp. Chile5]
MSGAWRKGAECEGVACEHELGQQPLQLLSYLWLKAQPTAADSGSSSDGKGVFTFVLADTVVFKQQKPVKWLFTSKQEPGKVLCKTKKFLTAGRVLQEFIVSKWMPSALANLDEDACILASYRFVPTKSGYNHALRSIYTPENCTSQKCISPFLLSDRNASVVQRTATFEIDDPPLRYSECRLFFFFETPTTKASARMVQRSMTSNELLHLPAKPEETRKPVVVQRRAVSAGAARMGLSKKDKKPSISQFGRHFARFLPRLQTFEPSAPAPAPAPKSAVVQLALHLKRNCGHPSLRFALSQCNVFPIGSVLPQYALAGICSADLLAQVMQYVSTLCSFHSPLR